MNKQITPIERLSAPSKEPSVQDTGDFPRVWKQPFKRVTTPSIAQSKKSSIPEPIVEKKPESRANKRIVDVNPALKPEPTNPQPSNLHKLGIISPTKDIR